MRAFQHLPRCGLALTLALPLPAVAGDSTIQLATLFQWMPLIIPLNLSLALVIPLIVKRRHTEPDCAALARSR